jgi:hypothetical protein
VKHDDRDNDDTQGYSHEQWAAALHWTPLGDASANGGDHSGAVATTAYTTMSGAPNAGTSR